MLILIENIKEGRENRKGKELYCRLEESWKRKEEREWTGISDDNFYRQTFGTSLSKFLPWPWWLPLLIHTYSNNFSLPFIKRGIPISPLFFFLLKNPSFSNSLFLCFSTLKQSTTCFVQSTQIFIWGLFVLPRFWSFGSLLRFRHSGVSREIKYLIKE